MERGPLRLSQSPLLPLTLPLRLTLLLMLMPGTATMAMDTVATDIVAMDTVDTTAPMATMATERGPLKLSQSPLLPLTLPLWLTPLLMLMPGTATMAMDTVDMDTVDTTALMATMAMERGLLMLSQSPPLLPTPTLLLTPGMAMDTVAMDTVDTTGLMATMATDCTERGPQRLSQSPLLL